MCAAVRAQLQDTESVGAATRSCVRCHQQRHPLYFDAAADICKACLHHETFRHAVSSVCAKPHAVNDMREKSQGDGLFVCYSCAPTTGSTACATASSS